MSVSPMPCTNMNNPETSNQLNPIESIKDAAKTIASSTMSFYSDRDSDIPGIVSSSLYWEGSVLFSVMMRYWALTGDDSHNDAVSEGMYWLRGDNDDYMSANYSSYMGNDDQLTWGLAAMMAAELDFPQKPSMPSWATLAENVWNSVSSRWDDSNCDGGLRWQIWAYQAGYGFKNAVSNGALFELSARLAHYTKNQTYSDWAEKIWDWSATTPLLKEKTWTIADSTSCEKNCSDSSSYQWTFNYAVYMSGAAYMYNVVSARQAVDFKRLQEKSTQWLTRITLRPRVRVSGRPDSAASSTHPSSSSPRNTAVISCPKSSANQSRNVTETKSSSKVFSHKACLSSHKSRHTPKTILCSCFGALPLELQPHALVARRRTFVVRLGTRTSMMARILWSNSLV